MKKFTVHKGNTVPMDRANVDTDMIIPKQFLKSIKRSGFGPNLFDQLRYMDEGVPGADCSDRPLNPDFPLNHKRHQQASVMLARENFGCGSSREHAPWALEDHGIRAIIAPSFADIFFNNCFKNGVLPIVLEHQVVDSLFKELFDQEEEYHIEVDLHEQEVRTPNGDVYSFDVDVFRKHCLIHGLDDVGITLEDEDEIRAFEKRWQQQSPWLFGAIQ